MQSVESTKLPKAAAGKSGQVEVLKAHAVNLQNLPMIPEVAIKALTVVRNPDSSMRTLSAVIERDAALATGILKLANSALYHTGRTIESLDQAVVRLGMRETQNLIITVAMSSLYRKLPVSKRQRFEKLWRHSFTSACLARRLNSQLKLGFRGEEFAGGICHDIGRVLIALGAPAYSDLADPMDFQEDPAILVREQDILGTDHCTFGAWFATLNELPESLVAVIRFHHAPAGAGAHHSLVGLIAIADHMANYLQRDQKIEEYDPATNTGLGSLAGVWEESTLSQFAEQARTVMAEVIQEVDGIIRVSVT